jgi:hypothetical protein
MMLTGCDQAFDLTPVTLHDARPDMPPDGPEEWGFSIVQPVLNLNHTTASDGDPTLTSDMTEIYFKSSRTTGGAGLEDIWYSTRATVSDAWSEPALSSLSTAAHDNQPRIAPDGLTIWFRRGAGVLAQLMVSTRSSAMDDSLWSTPMVLMELDAKSPDPEDAALMSSASPPVVGFLMSKRSNSTNLRIHRTTRANATAAWGIPEEVIELAGGTYEQSPWVTPDQLTIVFDSDRAGCVGGGDLWLASRASAGDPFGAPICLREINSFSFESAPWISPDLRHVFYRSGGSGGGDIWEAHR